eukprot:gene9039-12186_t
MSFFAPINKKKDISAFGGKRSNSADSSRKQTVDNSNSKLVQQQKLLSPTIPIPTAETPNIKDMFIVHGLIGEGGFAIVLTAMLIKNKKWYAIKEINKTELLKHKTGQSMVFGELKSLQRVDHPFIVSLHFAFQDKIACYMVLDLKTGGDLRYYLRKKMVFEEEDVAFYVSCISSALEHIHSRNIIHRDIKPENIILDEMGYPHLADFGVAHFHDPSTSESTTLTCNLASGTKQYLAPEVFTKTHVHGPEADYWSLGVVAYELLYGKRPFEKHVPTSMIMYLEKSLISPTIMKDRVTFAGDSKSRLSTKDSNFTSRGSSNNLSSCSQGFSQAYTSDSSISKEMIERGSSNSMVYSNNLPPINSNGHGEGRIGLNNSSGSSGIPSPHGSFSSQLSPMNSNVKMSKGIAARSVSCSSFDELQSSLGLGSGSGGSGSHKVNEIKHELDLNISTRFSHDNSHSSLLPCLTPPRPKPRAQTLLNSTENITEENLFLRLPAGCHWDVDNIINLPTTLCVHIPHANNWLGVISPACIDFLQGLFEVRPNKRLGNKDIKSLENHQWLKEKNVFDWNLLGNKSYRPHFRPGKRFIQEAFINSVDKLHEHERNQAALDYYGTDNNNSQVSYQDEDSFKEFAYISSSFKEYVSTSPTATPIAMNANVPSTVLRPTPQHANNVTRNDVKTSHGERRTRHGK